MPRHLWSSVALPVQHTLEARGLAEAAALVAHAVWTVDALHYLADVDCPIDARGHDLQVVDIAHVRWATGTAVTALDLCAAVLARVFLGHATKHEYDLRDFEPPPLVIPPAVPSKNARERSQDRASLPADAVTWVDAVIGDKDYKPVMATRNPMTHARLPRHLSTGSRTRYEFGGGQLTVTEIVERATTFATRSVENFLAIAF
ncbi:MAG: hypothetical protein NT062_11280 [Proteobacteria bacterium]|nr:hypothetical protein [Pseudomonadota bacterium]